MAFKPFKFLGNVVKGLVRGLIDALPFPQIKDAINEMDIRKALQIIESAKATDGQTLQNVVAQVHDILDDGQLNQSYNEQKVKARTRIIGGAIPAVAYVIYVITTGDFIIF